MSTVQNLNFAGQRVTARGGTRYLVAADGSVSPADEDLRDFYALGFIVANGGAIGPGVTLTTSAVTSSHGTYFVDVANPSAFQAGFSVQVTDDGTNVLQGTVNAAGGATLALVPTSITGDPTLIPIGSTFTFCGPQGPAGATGATGPTGP